MEKIRVVHERVTFTLDFDVFSNLVDRYEDNIAEYRRENRDKDVQDNVVLEPEDIIAYVYESFKDYLPLDREINIKNGFFERYYDGFDISVKLQTSTDKRFSRLRPEIVGKPYEGRFDAWEKLS